MKRNYITPVITEQGIQYSQVLCASGGGRSINSNVGLHGGTNSGNVVAAF